MKVDEELRAREPVSFDDLEERVEDEERQLQRTLRRLARGFPQAAKDTGIVGSVRAAVRRLRDLMKEAKGIAQSYDEGRGKMLHLAGLGLMVEILAHEINRATEHTLATLATGRGKRMGVSDRELLGTLEDQLKTLQKRLKILDPMSTAGRRRRTSFDLTEVAESVLVSHQAQFSRHGIDDGVEVLPPRTSRRFKVKLVKGMTIQILENLISNSVYWMKQEKKLDRRFKGQIKITLDKKAKALRFWDNGPGVPVEQEEEVFQAFVTSKPPGEGKGLGLYISRELAKYNGLDLRLSDESSPHEGRLNTFVLSLEGQPE